MRSTGVTAKRLKSSFKNWAGAIFGSVFMHKTPIGCGAILKIIKPALAASDYADELPDDIANGETESAAMNHFIDELKSTGYLHNHARMYLAAYIVHWRRVKWQAGAVFFLQYLLDGDAASNNLSFQWVASTFANKPYFFNLDNLQKFAGMQAPCDYHANKCFGGTYDDLAMRLFPDLEAL